MPLPLGKSNKFTHLLSKCVAHNDVQVQQVQVKSKSAWLCIKSSQVQVHFPKKPTKSSQVQVHFPKN